MGAILRSMTSLMSSGIYVLLLFLWSVIISARWLGQGILQKLFLFFSVFDSCKSQNLHAIGAVFVLMSCLECSTCLTCERCVLLKRRVKKTHWFPFRFNCVWKSCLRLFFIWMSYGNRDAFCDKICLEYVCMCLPMFLCLHMIMHSRARVCVLKCSRLLF